MARPIGDGNRAIHLHLPRLTSLTPLAIGGVDRLTWVKYAPQEQYVVRSLDPIDLPQSGPVYDPLMNVHDVLQRICLLLTQRGHPRCLRIIRCLGSWVERAIKRVLVPSSKN